MGARRNLDNSSIITAECMALRDGILAAKMNGYSNLEIEGDYKLVMDSYSKRINTSCSIILLMEDI